MYLGTLGPSNDFPTVLDAARKLQNEKLARFTIAGSGEQAREIALSLKTSRISNVDFHNRIIPHRAVSEWLERADALILPLRRGFGDTSFPSKLGEYLASGRPVICMTDGQLGKTISESEIAILVEPGSVAGLVEAIVWILKNPSLSASLSSNGREYARNNLSYDAFSKKTNKILEATQHIVCN
jgi:colanic acid biosynthesis glycosyl transferase WcaI